MIRTAVSASLVDVLPVPAYLCGRDGTILAWNGLAEEAWGMAPVSHETDGEFWKRCARRQADGRPLPHAASAMGLMLAGSAGPRTAWETIVRPDGSELHALVSAGPVPDVGDGTPGFIATPHLGAPLEHVETLALAG